MQAGKTTNSAQWRSCGSASTSIPPCAIRQSPSTLCPAFVPSLLRYLYLLLLLLRIPPHANLISPWHRLSSGPHPLNGSVARPSPAQDSLQGSELQWPPSGGSLPRPPWPGDLSCAPLRLRSFTLPLPAAPQIQVHFWISFLPLESSESISDPCPSDSLLQQAINRAGCFPFPP